MSSLGIIQEEPPQACEMCGVISECRPYGQNDEEICFDCAMKDPDTTERKMANYLFGVDK